MTLDAAKWNGTGGELSSCVISTSIRSCNYCNCMLLLYSPLNSYIYVHWILNKYYYYYMYYNVRKTFGTNLPVDFLSFFLCTYIYVYVSYVL